jgi:hypothetical protein
VCIFARFESEIWILNVLVAPYFGCLCVCRGVVFLFLDGKMVDFGDDFCFINRFKPAVIEVNEALSSWKRDVSL